MLLYSDDLKRQLFDFHSFPVVQFSDCFCVLQDEDNLTNLTQEELHAKQLSLVRAHLAKHGAVGNQPQGRPVAARVHRRLRARWMQ